MTNEHPLGLTGFEVRELARHPHAWPEPDDTLVIERRVPRHPEWVVRSRFFTGGEGLVLTALSVEPATLYPWPPKEPLNQVILRSIVTRELFRQAQGALSRGHMIGAPMQDVASEFHGKRHPGRARRPDRFYADIAARYVALVPSGSPTQRLKEELNVSASQARDLVNAARRKGMLTKSPEGQAGGHLTEKAMKLLSGQED